MPRERGSRALPVGLRDATCAESRSRCRSRRGLRSNRLRRYATPGTRGYATLVFPLSYRLVEGMPTMRVSTPRSVERRYARRWLLTNWRPSNTGSLNETRVCFTSIARPQAAEDKTRDANELLALR